MPDPNPAPDYANMSEAELDALFAKGEGFVPTEPEKVAEPAPVPEPEPEPEPKAAQPAEPETPPQAEPPAVEVEDDLAKLEEEGLRLEREKLKADLALQQAHSSRLAGEIGYLKKQLESTPREAREPYEPQTPEEQDRLTRLEQAFLESERKRSQLAVAQAAETAINALDAPELASIRSEIAEVAPKYREQLASAREVNDPTLARQLADAIGRSVIADAKELAWTNRRKALEEKRTVQQAALTARKKSAAVSGGSASSAPRPAPKTYDQMTPEELDAEMEKEFGRR